MYSGGKIVISDDIQGFLSNKSCLASRCAVLHSAFLKVEVPQNNAQALIARCSNHLYMLVLEYHCLVGTSLREYVHLLVSW